MLKQIGKLITEPLRKGEKSWPLRWRMGMRLNHIHNDLHSHHTKLWNVIVMSARALICKPFGHRWTRFEAVKYGDFGSSRICKHRASVTGNTVASTPTTKPIDRAA